MGLYEENKLTKAQALKQAQELNKKTGEEIVVLYNETDKDYVVFRSEDYNTLGESDKINREDYQEVKVFDETPIDETPETPTEETPEETEGGSEEETPTEGSEESGSEEMFGSEEETPEEPTEGGNEEETPVKSKSTIERPEESEFDFDEEEKESKKPEEGEFDFNEE